MQVVEGGHSHKGEPLCSTAGAGCSTQSRVACRKQTIERNGQGEQRLGGEASLTGCRCRREARKAAKGVRVRTTLKAKKETTAERTSLAWPSGSAPWEEAARQGLQDESGPPDARQEGGAEEL